MFVISKNSLYRGSIPYILLYLWPGHRISFVISRTSLNRGSLNRGSTVLQQCARKRGGVGGGAGIVLNVSYRYLVF